MEKSARWWHLLCTSPVLYRTFTKWRNINRFKQGENVDDSTLQSSTLMMQMLHSGYGGYYDMYTAIHVKVRKSFTLFCTDLRGGQCIHKFSIVSKIQHTCKWSQLNIFESASCIYINHKTITFFCTINFYKVYHLKFDKIKTKAFLVWYKKRNLHAKLQH